MVPDVTVLVKADRLDAATEEALAFAGGLRAPDVRAVHVVDGTNPGSVAARWLDVGGDQLELLPACGSADDFERRSLRSALQRTPEFLPRPACRRTFASS